ncbi:MAG: response regulator transcription factor [Verrucomicrobiota bacterium]
MRLLLVEDTQGLREKIAHALKRSGYAVDTADNGRDGLWMAQNHDYDAAILDIMLPELDGIGILEQLRKDGIETAVMFLTAKDAIDDRVKGLQSGADDYLVKPFALEELLARVQALCRRSHGQASPKIEIADLVINTAAKSVTRNGTPIDLPAREYALLEYLAHRQGQVVSRTVIEEHIYDEFVSPMSNVVDAAIYTLRKKLAVSKNSPPLIHTRRGQGYILEDRSQ